MKSDLQISQETPKKKIIDIASKLGLFEENVQLYGAYKAKIDVAVIEQRQHKPDGNLILVTAMSPTPAGEGKTTTTIGLGMALNQLGHNAISAIREPSLGPVMGLKGGACGGGYAQAIPMEEINLHFTGDLHAITSANNLLASLIDHALQGANPLRIDSNRIEWNRSLDLNDRALRKVVVGLGGSENGIVREESFSITAASEVMAIVCLSTSLLNLKERLGNILIAYDVTGKPIYARDISAHKAMAVLLKDAINPNLVQTIEHTPVLVHGGPFANIAHGCSSLLSTKLGLKLADYCITEAGFGADLGAEKFLHIKCSVGGLTPKVVVLVATLRAIKYHGGLKTDEWAKPNAEALLKGFSNLRKHIQNLQKFNLPVIVAINRFQEDIEEEIDWLIQTCKQCGVLAIPSTCFAEGGKGGLELAKAIHHTVSNNASAGEIMFQPLYASHHSLQEKIQIIAKEVYGAKNILFEGKSKRQMKKIEDSHLSHLPICMAKTPYSFSDDPKQLGAPSGFDLHIQEIQPKLGAGFIVVRTGDIRTMPGLPKVPAANRLDIDEKGNIVGLF